MKKFLLTRYYKLKLKYIKALYLLRKLSLIPKITGIFFKEYIHTSFSFFNTLGKLNKAVFISVFAMVFIASGIFLGKSYSQDFPTPTTDSSTGQTTSYGIPPGAVQSEMVQFFSTVTQIIQGTTDSSGTYAGGLLQLTSGLDAYVYSNDPISFTRYANFYAQSHGFIQNTYAASATTGSGYNALAPVIPLWELTRNIAYLIIAIMIVVIGFIIIFGGKYGQTEITIVNSIPKIILALILITFSYPIAGFAMDLSNLGTNMIVNVLGPQFVNKNVFYPGQYPVSCDKPLIINSSNPVVNGAQFSSDSTANECGYYSENKASAGLGGDFSIFRLMAPIIQYQNWSGTTNGAGNITQLIQTPTNIGILDFFLGGTKFGLTGLADYTINFILEVLFLYWSIKIFILIMTSFIRIVMATLTGPLVLVGYPLNGGGVFWNYAKGLLAPALVFPAVFGLLFIAAIFAFGTDCTTNGGGTANVGTSTPCVNNLSEANYGPWYIANNNNIINFNSGPLVFVDTVNPAFIWNFVAIGIIVIIPGIGKQLDEAFKNEISRHFEEQGKQAGSNALKYLSKVPVLGRVLGNVI